LHDSPLELATVTRHDVLRWVFTRWAFGVLCCALAAITAAAQSQPPAGPTDRGAATAAAQAKENRDAPELADFKKRAEDFGALHRKLDATLPKLPNEATGEQIDRHQRALATLISSSRPQARPGDIFTPPAQAYVRALIQKLFANSNKRQLRDSILDENTGPVKLAVNGRYPDQVPLATMPPEVLQALPALPRELEYRFVGDALILLDPDAQVVIDFIPDALPK
jgi:hypothetical protein